MPDDEVKVIQGTNEEIANELQDEATDVDYKAEAEKLQADVKKLQTSLTRQGYELGELRQINSKFDAFMLSHQPKTEPVDFFTDPAKAVAQGIEQHPQILKLKQEGEALRQQRMVLQLKEVHPDAQEIAKDVEFIDWVQSSKIRTRLFQDGNNGFDFDSANELLTNWKERKEIANTSKAEQELKQKSDENLKSAKVHTGTGVSGKKIYSRLDLMKLKNNDPDAYLALNVQKLYADGRVR